MTPILVSRKDAARRAGLGLSYFDALRRKGILPAPIVGAKYRWLDIEQALLGIEKRCASPFPKKTKR